MTSKKISFGKISFSATTNSSDPSCSSDKADTGFGVISETTLKQNEQNLLNNSNSNNSQSSKTSTNSLKQAKSYDIDDMMNKFHEAKVELNKINTLSETKDVENADSQISQIMGFSGFGKMSKIDDKNKMKSDKNKSKKEETVETKNANFIPSTKPKTIDENDKLDESKYDSDTSASSDDTGNDAIQLPITHEISLDHSAKAVSGLALDPSGARLVTGSQDFDVKFWDFNAMDSRFQSFRCIQPMENYHIRSIEYSISGDSILIAGGGPQAQVLDRDGIQLYECRKGDQYIMDMIRTNGHVSALYNAVWHTKDKNIFMTSSADCTVRLWDMNVIKNQKTVIKLKGSDGKKICPTHAVFNKDSSMIAISTIDGCISLFPSKGPFIRAKVCNKTAHGNGTETSCLKFSMDGNRLISRGGDGTLKLFDVRNIKEPVHSIENLENVFLGTDCWFSPDEKVVMTGTSVKRGSGELVFYETDAFNELYRFSVGEASVSKILWHPKLNQIVVGCSNGQVKIYYNPDLSSRGALLCAAKPRRRQVKNDEIPTGLEQQIINPYSLPMYREQRFFYAKRRKDKARKNPTSSAAPDKPAYGLDAHKTKGCSMSAFVSKQLALDVHGPPAEEEDPREALLKYADVCEKDPYWIAPAYGPETKNVYQDVTEETVDSEEPPSKKPMYFYNK